MAGAGVRHRRAGRASVRRPRAGRRPRGPAGGRRRPRARRPTDRRTLGGGIGVYTGRDRGRVESLASVQRNEELISLGGAFGGIAALLAIFVVAATLGLSVLQRGRELALLRVVGAKPRQAGGCWLGRLPWSR